MSISEVTVFGADQEISPLIHDAVMKELQGNYLGMFSRQNIFLYPKQVLIKEIQSTFPRVLDVAISRDGLTHLRIAVSQKIPRAIVCATLPNFEHDVLLLDDTDMCYLADEQGYLFERSPGFSGHPYNVYYAPDIYSAASTTDYIGSYATSTAEFLDLQALYDTVESAGMSPDGILIKDAGEYELYASTTIIYFNDIQHIDKERDNLIAFWRHMTTEARSQRKALMFDYIDLRFGSNVFYKTIK
ncbi:MAG TPA: hypothetical protein VL335_00970 [Candidatus Paceibacterota bacterium]|jgi:hypothetical protein|nr:hypothetical protein [Candidatus Paceibacterota bacterium]